MKEEQLTVQRFGEGKMRVVHFGSADKTLIRLYENPSM
jgi:hypothetical protein